MVRKIVAVVLFLQLSSVFALASIQEVGGHLINGNRILKLNDITSDGRYVLFSRYWPNNRELDELYLYDRQNDTYELIANNLNYLYLDNGKKLANISNDGNKITYFSWDVAWNYNNFYLATYDRTTGNRSLFPLSSFRPDYASSVMDGIGHYIAYSHIWQWDSGDRYAVQARIYDSITGADNLISYDLDTPYSNGRQNEGNVNCISDNGRYVVVTSTNTLTPDDVDPGGWEYGDTFIYDTSTEELIKILEHPDYAEQFYPMGVSSISDSGQKLLMSEAVVHSGPAPIPDPSRIFVYDVPTQTYTEDVTFSTSGAYANHDSHHARSSLDGRFVVFESDATNLVGADTNGYKDIFIRDRIAHLTQKISIANDGNEGNGYSQNPIVSDDGRTIAFESYASNFTTTNLGLYTPRIYVADRQPFAVTLAEYNPKKHTLTVAATSDLGVNNSLLLEGYGQMTYSRSSWSIVVTNVAVNPGTVTVTAIEGSVTVPTVVK